MSISYDLISNLGARLNDSNSYYDKPDEFTRYMGGHTRSNQPHITGYHLVWVQLPEMLFGSEAESAMKWIHSTCESFTPHTITLDTVDVGGIGKLGFSFPVSKTVTREFTLTFREYRKLPILNIVRTWQSMFDEHVGISPLSGRNFIPTSYKGAVAVAILRPGGNLTASGRNGANIGNSIGSSLGGYVGGKIGQYIGGKIDEHNADGQIGIDEIEEAYYYEGVFPTSSPEDTVTSSDQATNDTVAASITFKFDGAPLTKADGVDKFIVERFSDSVYSYQTTYSKIGANISN